MARKPIEHELVGLLTPRERIWRSVRRLKVFTMLELQDGTTPLVHYQTCQSYVAWLLKAGYLRVEVRQSRSTQSGCYTDQIYHLARDSFEAPRVTRAGVPVEQGMANLAMWRAMKVLREFDWHDIQRAASTHDFSVSPHTAACYVRALARAGYFRVIVAARPGKAGRFRLVRDTGAHAPAITRRKVVFDRNTGQFPWQQDAQEVCDGLE